MIETIEYWQHRGSGDTYAVRGEYGSGAYPVKVTGVVGPLHYTDVTAANLSAEHFDFTEYAEDVDWVQDHNEDFALLEAPYKGDLALAET